MDSSCNDIAIFYPSLMHLSSGKLYIEGSHAPPMNIIFSNDMGAHTPEIRHFIDADTLASLDSGENVTLVTPTPACNRVNGKQMFEESILGMLPVALHLQISIEQGPRKGEKISVTLDQVLVIRRLPVQLHVSTKRLYRTAQDSDLVLAGARLDFASSNVPESFRDHAYWQESTVHFIGTVSAEVETARRNLLESSLLESGDEVTVISCAICSITTGLLRCGRCKIIFYCGREHQRAHWSIHKHSCTETTSEVKEKIQEM